METRTNQVWVFLKADVEFELLDERRMGEDEEHLGEQEQSTLGTNLRRVHLRRKV